MINISSKIEKNDNGNWCFMWEFDNSIFDDKTINVCEVVKEDFYNLVSFIYEDLVRRGDIK